MPAFLSPEEFGSRLQHLRREEGINQARLAEVLAVDQPTVSRIESGERSLTLREAMAFAAFFDVELAHLVMEQEQGVVALRSAYASEAGALAAIDGLQAIVRDFFGLRALVS